MYMGNKDKEGRHEINYIPLNFNENFSPVTMSPIIMSLTYPTVNE